MMGELLFQSFGVMAVASPALLLVLLGMMQLLGLVPGERWVSRLTQIGVASGLFGTVAVLAMMLATGRRDVPIELGDWVAIEQEQFYFHLKFVFDRLSVPFTILCFVLCGTIGAFAKVYLHREQGYYRFFLFYAVFLLGMVVSSLAGTIETLFFGWELVGLSSALLIAYFQERPIPVRNGIHVWVVYRIADSAFLIAALTLHHLTGGGDFAGLMGSGAWPDNVARIDSGPALVVGLLLLIAAAGKSGMVPFSGWLPRAMEGPTPSSAIFYGALSVHLGAFLLLRVGPVLEASIVLQMAVIAVGSTSAIFGAMTARVQTDVKSALAYASLTQVGIIVVEIGCGLRYVALVHIMGHALLRTLQLVRAPSLLQDYLDLENAIGDLLPNAQPKLVPLVGSLQNNGWYRFCFERGYLDSALRRYAIRPFLQAFRKALELEHCWTHFLSGGESPHDRPRDRSEHLMNVGVRPNSVPDLQVALVSQSDGVKEAS